MVRWKRGIENVSPPDALSPRVHLTCPSRCKGRWHWEGENRGFVRGQPQALAVAGHGGGRWEQAVPGQSWGRADHPGRDGTVESFRPQTPADGANADGWDYGVKTHSRAWLGARGTPDCPRAGA